MRTIRIYIVALCLAIFSIQPLSAQLLYEISGNGLKDKSYIFGTHHLVGAEQLERIKGVFKAYNDCEVVVGEMLIDESEMMKKLTYAAYMNENIRDYLTDSEYDMVDSVLRQTMNLTLSQVARLRPAMIQYMYEMTVYEKFLPKRNREMLDSFFQNSAIYQSKKVVGLESVDEQVKLLLKSQSIERQVELLLVSINNSDNVADEYKRLEEYYLNGDLDKLYDMINDTTLPGSYTEGERFLILEQRNVNWVEKLNSLIRDNRCFIAVGALHLPGKEGILQLLRKKGFRVKAVN